MFYRDEAPYGTILMDICIFGVKLFWTGRLCIANVPWVVLNMRIVPATRGPL